MRTGMCRFIWGVPPWTSSGLGAPWRTWTRFQPRGTSVHCAETERRLNRRLVPGTIDKEVGRFPNRVAVILTSPCRLSKHQRNHTFAATDSIAVVKRKTLHYPGSSHLANAYFVCTVALNDKRTGPTADLPSRTSGVRLSLPVLRKCPGSVASGGANCRHSMDAGCRDASHDGRPLLGDAWHLLSAAESDRLAERTEWK